MSAVPYSTSRLTYRLETRITSTPWPIDYDPPAFSYPPGDHPPELRMLWYTWAELWDVFAEDPTVEMASALFVTYDQLTAHGVRFDRRFIEDFADWREAAAKAVDENDDPDDDISHDGDQ